MSGTGLGKTNGARTRPAGTGWTIDLAVGMPLIDAQHQELFTRIDGLLRAIDEMRLDGEVSRMIGFLETYVLLHFGTEERLMVRCGYPAYAPHRATHERFHADFALIKKQYETEGPTLAVATAVASRVRDWLIGHISTADREFGAFLAKQPGK